MSGLSKGVMRNISFSTNFNGQKFFFKIFFQTPPAGQKFENTLFTICEEHLFQEKFRCLKCAVDFCDNCFQSKHSQCSSITRITRSTLLEKQTVKKTELGAYDKTLDELLKLWPVFQQLVELAEDSKLEFSTHQKVDRPLSSSKIQLSTSKMIRMLLLHRQKLLKLKEATLGSIEKSFSQIEQALESANDLWMQDYVVTLEERLELCGKFQLCWSTILLLRSK